jgi:hypothetical protein
MRVFFETSVSACAGLAIADGVSTKAQPMMGRMRTE